MLATFTLSDTLYLCNQQPRALFFHYGFSWSVLQINIHRHWKYKARNLSMQVKNVTAPHECCYSKDEQKLFDWCLYSQAVCE